MKRRGIIKWIVGLAGFFFVAFVTMLLVLPRIIDSQAVKEKIRTFLSEKANGSVAIEKIDLHWAPRPEVVIRNGGISVADGTRGTFETLRVYPSILALLTGRLIVRRAALERPAITVKLAQPFEEPFDLQEVERKVRAWLAELASKIPAAVVLIEQGSAEISIGDGSPVLVKDFDGRFSGPPDRFTANFTATSNLCGRFHAEGTISAFDLATAAKIKFERLRVREAVDSLLPRRAEYLEDGEMSLDLDLSSLGLRRFNLKFAGSLPELTLARKGERTLIKGKDFRGTYALDEGIARLVVERLDLISPRLTASGEFMMDRSSSSVHLKLSAQDLDVNEIRNQALRTAGDVRIVQQIFQYVRAGTIPKIAFESKGRSLPDLAKAQNMIVDGEMRSGRVFVPDPDLDLENVDGSVAIAGGTLEGKNISARLGGAKGWDGKLRLGLEGKSAPFHLDVMIASNAAELQSRLLRLVKNEPFQRVVSRLRDVKGELSGRIVLGDKLDAVSPLVTVMQTDVSAIYDPIPFPIAVKGGRFNYDQSAIRLENAQLSVGRSTFAGLNATLQIDEGRQINIDSGRVSLDLEQTDTLIRSFEGFRSRLIKLQSARGTLEVGNFNGTGSLDDPAGWNFRSAGTVKQVALRHADLPGLLILSQGKFTATQAGIQFSDAAVKIMDASLIAGGNFENPKGDPVKLEVSATGVIGAQSAKWLSRQIELPEQLVLRSPLKIAAGRITWQAAGDISLRGKVNLAGGPQISFDLVSSPDRVAVRGLTVADGAQQAHLTLQLAKDNLDLSFKGALEEQILDKIFASLPSRGISLQGDIQVSASLKKPIRVSARGQVQGSNLLLPWEQEKALVEKFRIEADDENLLIRSAELRWRNSRLGVSGKVAEEKEALRVDLDVASDRIDWDEINRSFGRGGAREKDKADAILSLPGVHGTIRLKADNFTFGGFTLSPLRLTANSSPSGITADIDQAVACGINATGRVDAAGKEIGLDVQLSTTEAQLQPTTICLTDNRSDIKGTYTLKAQITGRGDRSQLLPSLGGNFEISARDGEFVRSAGVDATFDHLNATGDFNVVFPDLDKETFPYRSISARGSIEGQTLLVDEAIIRASWLTMTGQGTINLEDKVIDGKGLVSVQAPGAQVIKKVPIIGSILGGSVVGIPVRLTGSVERPNVSYLSPAALGTEILNMPLRILGVPLEALRLFTPSGAAGHESNAK